MGNRISLSTLGSRLAEQTGRSRRVCEDFVKEFFRLAADVLSDGESIRIKGFGSFKISDVDARNSINVATGEAQEIKAYKKVVFTPSKEMQALINAPFEMFESIEIDDEEPAKQILEAGGDEEEFDDEITYEAYHDSEVEMKESAEISMPQLNQHMMKEKSMDFPSEKINITDESEPSVETHEIESKETNNNQLEKELSDPEPEVIYIDSPSRFGKGFLMGSLSALIVCVVVFMLGCVFNWWPVNFGKVEILTENIGSQQEDMAQVVEKIDEIIKEENETPVYDTVSTTRYLTTIAREHYGNFNFWPYIYFENESILGHPDRIIPGTKVVVPDLAKYGVDANNKEDEKIAKQKGIEIYSRFK